MTISSSFILSFCCDFVAAVVLVVLNDRRIDVDTAVPSLSLERSWLEIRNLANESTIDGSTLSNRPPSRQTHNPGSRTKLEKVNAYAKEEDCWDTSPYVFDIGAFHSPHADRPPFRKRG
jgi:hypothetical protein